MPHPLSSQHYRWRADGSFGRLRVFSSGIKVVPTVPIDGGDIMALMRPDPTFYPSPRMAMREPVIPMREAFPRGQE